MDSLKELGKKAENFLWEATSIPWAGRKLKNLGEAYEQADPELARKQFIDIGSTALLWSIPVEKIFSPVFKPLVSPILGHFNVFKENFAKFAGKPIGEFASKYLWDPARILATKARGVEDLDPISKINLGEVSKLLKDRYNQATRPEERETLDRLASGLVNKPIATPISIGIFEPLKELDTTNFSPIEKETSMALSAFYEGTKHKLDIPNTLGVSNPEMVNMLIRDQAKIPRDIEPYAYKLTDRINKWGEKLGVENLADLAMKARENPALRQKIPKEAQHLPAIFGSFWDNTFKLLTNAGFKIRYWEHYIPHIIRGWAPNFESRNQIRVVSDFVRHIEPRAFGVTVDTLKDIAEGRIYKPEQIPGYLNGEEGHDAPLRDLFKKVSSYIKGKRVVDHPAEVLTAYLTAFTRANLSKTIDSVLTEAIVHPNFEWLRGSLTEKEYTDLDNLFTNVHKNLMDEGNTKSADQLFKIQGRILHEYVPGDKIGLDPNKLYHPKLAPVIEKNLLLPMERKSGGKILNILSTIKALKLSMSLFHYLNFISVSLASGDGLDSLFSSKTLKFLATPEGQNLASVAQTRGLEMFKSRRLFQEIWEHIDQQQGGVMPKLEQIIEANPMTKFIFEKQGVALQLRLYQGYKAKVLNLLKDKIGSGKPLKGAELALAYVTQSDIEREAAFYTNILSGTLRPEAMNNLARTVGNVYFLARNWTYSNLYLLLNAMHEWFIKTPTALGIFPKEVGDLFLRGMNAIQTMEGLPLESQLRLRKELAEFIGVALAQNQWRTQFANLMFTGHTTYENAPGHEQDIDYGMIEYKPDKNGTLRPHHIYGNAMGWLSDVYNLSPFHFPLPEVIHSGNIKEALKPWNYLDLGKVAKTAFNKGNVAWHSVWDISKALMFIKDTQEKNKKIAEELGVPFVPISIQQTYTSLVHRLKSPEQALEILILNVLGFPRKKLG